MFNKHVFLKSRNSVFFKIFASYVSVFTLPLFILGVISYLWASDIVKTQAEKTYLSSIQDIRKNVDAKINTLNSLSIHLSELSWVQKIMHMRGNTINYEEVNPFSFNNNIKDLNTFKGMNGFVSDMAIYFNDKDLVISTLGKNNLYSFCDEVFKYEGLSDKYWRSIFSKRNVMNILKPSAVLTYKQPRRLLAYIQSLPVSDSNPLATFIAFIDEGSLMDSLDKSSISGDGGLYILDSSNSFITGINCSNEIKDALAIREQSDPLSENTANNLTLTNSDRYLVFASVSAVNSWSYVAVIPLKTAMSKVNNIKLVTLAISALSLVMGLVLSYFLALKSYTPLANIVKSVSPKLLPGSSDHRPQNEYNFLQKAIHSMLEYENRTTQEIEIYKPLARNSLFIQLLKGQYSSGSNMLEVMDITFSNSCFTCISIILDGGSSLSQHLQGEIALKLSEHKAVAFFVDIGEINKVMLLNTAYEQQVESMLIITQEHMKKSSVSYKAMGVGKTYKGLENLYKSYDEANTALDYRFLRASHCIIYYNEIEASCMLPCYYYPNEKEEHLVNFIKCGNYNEAIKLFEEITRDNITARTISPTAVRHLFYNMAAAALKAVESLNIRNLPAFHLEEFLHMDTVHDMRRHIEELYRYVCNIIIREKESKNTRLMEDILSYIDIHLTDSNLSLTSISDSFSISIPYLSRFIKDQTGTNFVDYINRKRVELSKSLLKRSKTILQVALEAGFDNDITFRRVFKKYEGINPGEYRVIESRQ